MMSLNGPLNFLVNLAFIILISLLSACGRGQNLDQALDHNSGQVIVGDVDWKSIEDVSDTQVLANARAVAYIDLPAMQSRCTAFLISDNLLMTNQHCIPTSGDARGVTAYFEYTQSRGKTKAESVRCDEFVINDERLDFAILRCQGSPGQRYGRVQLQKTTVQSGQSVYVIHQNCDYYTTRACDWYKKYSQGRVTDLSNEIGHDADTLGGSSGSPLFQSGTHKLIGLHHVGIGSNGFGRGRMNYAVPVNDIVEFLQTSHPSVWQQVSGSGQNNQQRPPASSSEEPNNSLTQTFKLELGKSVEFGVDSSSDSDFFEFTVSGTKTVVAQLDFTHSKGDLELKLYRKNGTLLRSSTGSGDQEMVSRVLSTGNYVLKVYGYKGATGRYKLTVR